MDEKNMIDQDKNPNSAKIKRAFSIGTVILLSACAFMGILAIFVEANLTLFCLLSTLVILYLIFLVSMEDIRVLFNPNLSQNWLAVVALVANVFWGLPWILVVWGAFVDFDDLTVETIWRVIGSSAVISVYCTVLPMVLSGLREKPGVMKFFQSLPVVCATFLAIDFLVAIWAPDAGADLLGKFILAEIILIILQVLVAQILGYSSYKGLKVDRSVFENGAPAQPNAPAKPAPQAQGTDQQLRQENQDQAQEQQKDSALSAQNATQKPSAQSPQAERAESSDPDSVDHQSSEHKRSARPDSTLDEAKLRAEIEREVRAKIAAEQAEQAKRAQDADGRSS